MVGAFLSIIEARHCKRAFLDKPVPREILERVLRAAGHAPSPRNTQYWEVAVVTGSALVGLTDRLCAVFDADEPIRPDYPNRPDVVDPVYVRRGQLAGAGVHAALGIARDDKAGRRAHLRNNYRFYGAPVAMIFHLPKEAVAGTFLEMGFFFQNVMLGLVASGLGSCPQYSVAGYPDAIRDQLDLGPDRLIVASLSVGYPDESAPVNAFAPDRAELDEYVSWHETIGPE